MSKLLRPDGDDFPDAAQRHVADAATLHDARRYDGAAYIAGYVVECSLKSLILAEKGTSGPLPWKKGAQGHDLNVLCCLATNLASSAGAKIARFLGPAVRGIANQAIAAWKPEIRYRSSTIPPADAERSKNWLADARNVYRETVQRMFDEGVA